MKGFCSFLFIAAATCAALPADADEQFALTYRGRITAQQEMPVELVVTYSLYIGEDDVSPVWTQTKTERPAANGAFQTVLSGNGLQEAFQKENARFLGLRLGGSDAPEQYPRQEIIATPLVDYADAVGMAPFSPNFVNARVERIETTTFSVGSLVITNTLSFPMSDTLSLGNVLLGDGATLIINKSWLGHVQLFAGPPRNAEFTQQAVYPPGTVLFDGDATKGGLLVITTTDFGQWDQSYAAPCVTIPVAPGVIETPIYIRGPAKFYLYEFGN